MLLLVWERERSCQRQASLMTGSGNGLRFWWKCQEKAAWLYCHSSSSCKKLLFTQARIYVSSTKLSVIICYFSAVFRVSHNTSAGFFVTRERFWPLFSKRKILTICVDVKELSFRACRIFTFFLKKLFDYCARPRLVRCCFQTALQKWFTETVTSSLLLLNLFCCVIYLWM